MIIGICGRARSGKDTIAAIIMRDYGFKHLSFASPMKYAARVIFGWTAEHTDGSLKEVVDPAFGISPRQFLQILGTDFAQFMLPEKVPMFASVTGRSLWVNRLIAEAGDSPVVVSDVRFAHEAEAIQKSGGVVIRVRRREADAAPAVHASESGLADISADYTISNDGTFGELDEAVRSTMSRIADGVIAGEFGNFKETT